MRTLLCLALLCCTGCYLPNLSDPGGAQRTRRRMDLLDQQRQRMEDSWYRQDRLKLDRERLELERRRVNGW